MSKTIIDQLSKIPTLNTKDVCLAFQEIFYAIDNMGSSDIIAAKQAIDLMVKLSSALGDREQIIITHIIKAMQVRAAGHTLYNSRTYKNRYELVEKLFYLRNAASCDFRYNKNIKEFVIF